MSSGNQNLPDGATLTVTVFAPGSIEGRTFTWRKALTVREAAAAAATEMGFTGQNPTFMDANDSVLNRDKTLVASGVRDGSELELVDIGGGV